MSNIIPMNSPSYGQNDDLAVIERTAQHFLTSGLFKDLRSVSQAVVKILKGRELGIGPYSSIDSINVIQGKLAINANLLAALIRKSKAYDYKITELTPKSCSIVITQDKQPLYPTHTFTIEDAKAAGLTRNQTYTAYPRNMLFARCISNASRFHCPDVTHGVYVPEDFPDFETPQNYEVAINPSDVDVVIKVAEVGDDNVEYLMFLTSTTIEALNTAVGMSFTSISDIAAEPFAVSYLKTKKEAMGK
jgi:hypothetical protein